MDKNIFEKAFETLFGGDKDVFERIFQAILEERGHANVLVAGRSGVGKSTLINSVFQGDFATLGQGELVTKNTRKITREEFPFSIFETRGLETEEFTSTLKALENYLAKQNGNRDEKDRIHVAWICIAEGSRKIGRAEKELVEIVSKYIPMIGVITKSEGDQQFRLEIERLLPQLRSLVGVQDVRKQGDGGQNMARTDFEELALSTAEHIPKSEKMAFIVAQKANCKLKHDYALEIVTKNALLAGGTGAVPAPGAVDLALLTIQARMLIKISFVYIISSSSAFLSTMVGSVVGGAIATLTGRLIVGSVTRMIPGIGSVIGATTAAALTTGMGAAYISILNGLCVKHRGESPGEEEILAEIKPQ